MNAETPERVQVTIVMSVQRGDADVQAVVAALQRELEQSGRSWEAILVYDGVRGAAWEGGLALQASSQDQVRTIALHRAFGESVCLSSAFEHARGEVIVTVPHYLQVAPASVLDLLAVLDEGADFAVGRREPRVDSVINRLQSWSFNWILRFFTGTPFRDLNCPVRAMRRAVLEQTVIYGNIFRYLPILAMRQGFEVREIPLAHREEEGGTGIFAPGVYVRRLLDILGVVFLTRFTHKPLRFFGALGGACMLLGFAVTATVGVRRFMEPGVVVWGSPFFLLGVLLFVLGAQIIGFGLVGEIIIFTQARNVREYRIERIYE